MTRKVIASACRIAAGAKETLQLGDLSIQRDWGWAPEYVEAMWLMLQQQQPDDYIVATGQTYALQDFAVPGKDLGVRGAKIAFYLVERGGSPGVACLNSY